jgi:drug/metabolite transporter (DMT)-like permease
VTAGTAHSEQRLKAALLAIAAVGVASGQDAIIKSMVGAMPAYEAVLIRGAIGAPILAVWLVLTAGFGALRTPLLWPLVLRGLVLCSAYFAFILAIAAMPIANGVAIYFTMPFFVATLAGPFLGERVPVYRWLAMIAAFVGVWIMVNPQAADFEPASGFALYSALGYAVGQMMGRHYSQRVNPIAIANVQNAVYFVCALILFAIFSLMDLHFTRHKSLEFLSRPAVWPSAHEWMLLSAMGVLAAFGSVVFTFAYKAASSSFVAPFEYTAMIWAVLYGVTFFGDFPTLRTWSGMALVVVAGLWMMWRDTRHNTG